MTDFRLYPEYVNLENTSKKLSEVFSKLRQGKPLQNKYLYLDSSGANNWSNVEGTLGLSQNEENLLEQHYEEIDNTIRELSNCKSYDIISLGCGTGTDDKTIINTIYGKMENQFSISTIDLSLDLLHKGTYNIYKEILGKYIKSKVDILGICCDFENLENAKSYLETRERNETRLYHLLGLTIGNNKELWLLKKIHDRMKNGDYLLLGVDLSADDTKALANSEAAYNVGNASTYVDEFLLGPLNFSTSFHVNRKYKDPFLHTKIKYSIEQCDEIDYLINGFKPILLKSRYSDNTDYSNKNNSKDSNKFSDIKNTVTFTRYYKFGPAQILCDYSNKYKADSFIEFINNLFGNNVFLKPVTGITKFGLREDLLGKHEPYQYLVLLRKVDPKQSIEEVDSLVKEVNNFLNYFENSKIDIDLLNQLKDNHIYDYLEKPDVILLRNAIFSLDRMNYEKLAPPSKQSYNDKEVYQSFCNNLISFVNTNIVREK
ncbi:MAG: L-histidine N(alpha)-methyltransferase [Melioribacteraceae bacterium]|nr:MAG: L-histidine N(alpha)-methyltransferase [Melioribacteraceae bacterium]